MEKRTDRARKTKKTHTHTICIAFSFTNHIRLMKMKCQNMLSRFQSECVAFFLFSIPMRDKWQSFHRISKAIRTENKVKSKREQENESRKKWNETKISFEKQAKGEKPQCDRILCWLSHLTFIRKSVRELIYVFHADHLSQAMNVRIITFSLLLFTFFPRFCALFLCSF